MKKMIQKKIAAWEKVAGEYCKILVPNRPSPDDCKNYGILIAKFLKNRKNSKIMVMGATPELRRILYTYESLAGAKVYCVDINPTMYRVMTNFLAKGRHPQEKFFPRSWLATQFPKQHFDLVVGDEVICNVDAKLHPRLFQEISRILKNDGIWITRHNFYLPETKENSVSKILIDLAVKIEKGEYCFQLAMNILYLRMFYYSSAMKKIDNTMANLLKIMRREWEKSLKNHQYSLIIEELINFYEDNFVPMAADYHWSVLSEKESERELKEFFTIEGKVYSSDHPFVKNGPIYTLKKRTSPVLSKEG
ncbi:MAG: class I SAM-dependent methyltransferase [Patescibacteria group bacterium]|nr:class I SAM-dependent methyltransferase [Patescibacteria group bacterium]